MTSGIYCIENKVNGKKYIGSSDNIEDRWIHHRSKLKTKSHSNNHLQRAYNKHGIENFLYYILEECYWENLEVKEDYYIDFYKTIEEDFGYNKKWAFGRKKNGTERVNRPMLDSVKEKISLKMKGKLKSEEWKEKVRKPKSEEWKSKIGESHIFKKLNVKKSSEYIGVYKNNKGRWIANIRINGEKIYIGIYGTEIEAAEAFDVEYCKNYNKKFGLNFPNKRHKGGF